MLSSAYYFEVTVHQTVAELCPFENFCKCFVHPYKLLFSGESLLLYVSIGATANYLPRPYDAPLSELLLTIRRRLGSPEE